MEKKKDPHEEMTETCLFDIICKHGKLTPSKMDKQEVPKSVWKTFKKELIALNNKNKTSSSTTTTTTSSRNNKDKNNKK